MKQMAGSIEQIKVGLFAELSKIKESVQGNTSDQLKIKSLQSTADGQIEDEQQANNEYDVMAAIRTFEAKAMEMLNSVKQLTDRLVAITQDIREKVDFLSRESNLNCLVLYGLSEEGHDTRASLDEACKQISEKLQIQLSSNDINYVTRMGKKFAETEGNKGRTRPLLIKFVHRWKRDIVYAKKKNLKATGLVMGELLSSDKLELYRATRNKVGEKASWTYRGNVYISLNGTRVRIDSEEALTNVPAKR